MGIVFFENKKRLEISILGYEFELSKGIDVYDANWLTVKFDYMSNEQVCSFTDNCLLANELEYLAISIKDIINGKETGIISDFIEPYLKFALTKVGDMYAVQIRFTYDTTGNWKEIYISQGMNREEICKMSDELQKLSNHFPFRKVD